MSSSYSTASDYRLNKLLDLMASPEEQRIVSITFTAKRENGQWIVLSLEILYFPEEKEKQSI